MESIINLKVQCVTGWPKLAWLATFPRGSRTIAIYHGPCVEIGRKWCVEAVWAGKFSDGDFDRTDLVFGSGIRCRENQVVFVSSGTTLDRLWYCLHRGVYHVTNSLPALLASAGLSLCEDYATYPEEMDTIRWGLSGYQRKFPTNSSDISPVYFSNLLYDGHDLKIVEKPDTASAFQTFHDYYEFLAQTACHLGENMKDASRMHRISPLTTVSRGYDASAATIIARHAGCRDAVTICQSTSLWRGSDSGDRIARRLGLSCKVCNRTAKRYPHEETIWAVVGRPGILNWALFEYPEPLCLFFSGAYGDKVWSRRHREYADPFEGTTLAHGGIGEFRLFRGVFHCPIPFWGMRHYRELRAVSFSDEMAPWTLYNSYDRPIPRRIVEEAGVPRRDFGMLKKNTSHEAFFLWPYSPEAKEGFQRYLQHRKLWAPSGAMLWMMRRAAFVDNLIYMNVVRRFKRPDPNPRKNRLRLKATSLIFHWANSELKDHYSKGLSDALLNVVDRSLERTDPGPDHLGDRETGSSDSA